MEDFWIKAISNWRTKQMGMTGCTLPYLLGIQTELIPSVQPTPIDIYKLVESLASNSINKSFLLQECKMIKKIVIGEGVWINESKATKFGNLWVDNEILPFNANLGAVCEMLVNQYGHIVNDGTFSWDNEKIRWGAYSDKDRNYITFVISN